MGSKVVFSFDHVSEHSNREDCWILIDGKVYNVTRFLDEHPGGDEVILAVTGKDATDDFEDVGHSANARAMMDEYYVGDIDASTVPVKQVFTLPKQEPYNPDKTSEFVMKILQFLVPLAIFGLAIAVRYYTKTTE